MSWFRRLFYGRYGFDLLSGFLLLAALPFAKSVYTWPIALFFSLLAIYRAFSKNLERRRRELWVFQQILGAAARWFIRVNGILRSRLRKVAAFFKLRQNRWRERKTHRYLRCPICKGVLRLPRHKGKIIVTCPVCKKEFKAKT